MLIIFIEKISELPKVGEIIGHDDRRAQAEIARLEEELRILKEEQ
jgi:hypothetical protein